MPSASAAPQTAAEAAASIAMMQWWSFMADARFRDEV
jgi:hypothetical protein